MPKRKSAILVLCFLVTLTMLACNIGAPEPIPTSTAIGSLPVSPTFTETMPASTETFTPPAATATVIMPPTTPTPQNPLVTATAYCWSGPTNNALKYEVISSIQAGTHVQLIGKGIVNGWWVVKNPRYGDPCWIQQQYVQIDPGYDLSNLRTFAVPPTPTATP